MALTTTAAVVPFPGGLVVPTAPPGQITGVALASGQTLPRAECQLYVASDPTAAADYRPAILPNGQPFSVPVGLGGVYEVPAGLIPVGAKIQVGLTNFGSAAATVNLISS